METNKKIIKLNKKLMELKEEKEELKEKVERLTRKLVQTEIRNLLKNTKNSETQGICQKLLNEDFPVFLDFDNGSEEFELEENIYLTYLQENEEYILEKFNEKENWYEELSISDNLIDILEDYNSFR